MRCARGFVVVAVRFRAVMGVLSGAGNKTCVALCPG